MTLSLKQKAMLITLCFIASAILGSMIVAFIVMNISAEMLSYLVFGSVCAWFSYIFYLCTLARLESQAQE